MRRVDAAGDHSLRFLEVSQVVGSPLAEGERERGRIGAAAGTACTLHVVGGLRRHVAHENGFEFAHVHAQLERGGAGEHIHVAAHEPLLQPRRGLTGKLCRVLLDDHANGFDAQSQLGVVVRREASGRIVGRERSFTAIRRADSAEVCACKVSAPVTLVQATFSESGRLKELVREAEDHAFVGKALRLKIRTKRSILARELLFPDLVDHLMRLSIIAIGTGDAPAQSAQEIEPTILFAAACGTPTEDSSLG